jgi:hypothetical protein
LGSQVVAWIPELSALLASATVTPVSVAGRPYESDDRRGWLWAVFGGTFEQFGGPSTLRLNQNEVLTVPAWQTSFSDVVGQYDWLWTDEKLPLPARSCCLSSPWR